ncbi:MAG: hypothetical protein QOG13_1521 [Sphingomonadales bacterium]|nr:hypothetical protein [Sphingomonadales bacterium]MEA3043718.1 hypothetical protein [Sphingomonadales bacterium]
MNARPQPFSGKLVAGLIAAGLAAFAALLLLIAYGDRIGPVGGARAPALSVGATGFKGLISLVGRFRETSTIDSPADLSTDDLLVVALDLNNRAQDVARLLALRSERATLLILPKWVTIPHDQRRGWVRTLGPGAGSAANDLIGGDVRVRILNDQRAPARGRDFLDGLSVPVPRAPQVIEGRDLTPLVTLPGGGALVARLGVQPHYVAADPDLFDNYGLRSPAQARAALALIDALNSSEQGGVAFDLTVNGLTNDNARSLLRTALEPPFLAMTLALVFAALLAGLHGAFRFGQARREERAIAFGKAALVENSAGLIRLAKREARLGGAYAEVIRQDAARLAAAPPALQGEALDAYLDRLTKGDSPPFSALAARLAGARDRHELVAAARALFSWKKDIIR